MMTSEIGVWGDRLSLSHALRLVSAHAVTARADLLAGRVSPALPAGTVNLQITKMLFITMFCDICVVQRTIQESRFLPPLRFAGAAPRHESDHTPSPPGANPMGGPARYFGENR